MTQRPDLPEDRPVPADPWQARQAPPPAPAEQPAAAEPGAPAVGAAGPAETPAADGATSGPVAQARADADAGEKEWWDNPGMPWRHEPTRADKACMAWIGFMGLYGLAMLPLRGWLLGLHAPLLAAFTGSRSATTATGALASQGMVHQWWWVLLAASLMSIKFDWVFWWAGKLWGRGMIEVWSGQSPRAQKNYERAERWAHKLGWLGMFVAYVPIPLPLMQVIFVLAGSTGMSIKKFMALDFLASTTWLCGFFLLGWQVGEPAVGLLKAYAKIGNYVAIALVVFIVVTTMRAQRKQQA